MVDETSQQGRDILRRLHAFRASRKRDLPAFRLHSEERDLGVASPGELVCDRGCGKVMGGEEACLDFVSAEEPPGAWLLLKLSSVNDEEMRRLQRAGGRDERLRGHVALVDGQSWASMGLENSDDLQADRVVTPQLIAHADDDDPGRILEERTEVI